MTSQDPSRVAGALRSRWIARRPTARGKESLRRQKVPGKIRPSLEPDPGAAQGSPNPSGWNLPARPHLVSPALKLHRGLSNGHLGHGAKPGPHPGGSSPCPRVTPTPAGDSGGLPPTPRAEERQMYYLLDDQGVGVGGGWCPTDSPLPLVLSFSWYFFFMFTFERERERERDRQTDRQSTSRGGAEREGDTESETGSRL